MATLTTHVLDSLSGRHAGGVGVALYRIDAEQKTLLFNAATDAGGRLRESVALDAADAGITCELVFQVAEYFARQDHDPAAHDTEILREAVFRFVLPDPDGAYHIPMMLAPNSYSVWFSNAS